MDRLLEHTYHSAEMDVFIATSRDTKNPWDIIVKKDNSSRCYPCKNLTQAINLSNLINSRMS